MWQTCHNTIQTENVVQQWLSTPYCAVVQRNERERDQVTANLLQHLTCWFIYFFLLTLLNFKIWSLRCCTVSLDVPFLDFPQHLGKLDGMQKKSADIKMATVPSVTYLRWKNIQNIGFNLVTTRYTVIRWAAGALTLCLCWRARWPSRV